MGSDDVEEEDVSSPDDDDSYQQLIDFSFMTPIQIPLSVLKQLPSTHSQNNEENTFKTPKLTIEDKEHSTFIYKNPSQTEDCVLVVKERQYILVLFTTAFDNFKSKRHCIPIKVSGMDPSAISHLQIPCSDDYIQLALTHMFDAKDIKEVKDWERMRKIIFATKWHDATQIPWFNWFSKDLMEIANTHEVWNLNHIHFVYAVSDDDILGSGIEIHEMVSHLAGTEQNDEAALAYCTSKGKNHLGWVMGDVFDHIRAFDFNGKKFSHVLPPIIEALPF